MIRYGYGLPPRGVGVPMGVLAGIVANAVAIFSNVGVDTSGEINSGVPDSRAVTGNVGIARESITKGPLARRTFPLAE